MLAARVRMLVSLVALLAPQLACHERPPRPPVVWSGPSADATITTLIPASYADGSGVTYEVRSECELEYVLPEWIARKTTAPVTLAVDPTGAARVLRLQITQVLGPPGGVWTGPKQLSVHGELVEGDTVIGSFNARRTTVTGGWARHEGTCEVLDYLAEALAEDIRPWLANPTHAAQLGEE